eukprot:TRINITY_DN19292_c0_g1_i2.p1 TRINITY_DN19292_c0_g1~~TRINITY_DN19292_c0_g1_i2.p1  ORF type:complete len:402 (+),score=59.98 TRINITY_DN19292_c0_g1_i2:74-1279(+)
MSIELGHVAQKWRRLAYSLWGILFTCLAVYLVFKVTSVLKHGEDLELGRDPHFGHLPDIKFARSSGAEFGYYSVTLQMGLQMQPEDVANRVDLRHQQGADGDAGNDYAVANGIGLTVDADSITFKTSELRLPKFDDIEKNHKHKGFAPQPKIEMDVLFKATSTNSPKGFYMFTEDPRSGRKSYLGGIEPEESPLAQGRARAYVFDCKKERHERLMTMDTLSMAGFAQGFRKSEERFIVESLFDVLLQNVSCVHDLEKYKYHFQPVPSGGQAAEKWDGSRRPLNSTHAACDGWRLLSVSFNFRDEAVEVYRWIGEPLQIVNLLGSFGGLWAVCTSVLMLCFVRKNVDSKTYMEMEERTWVLESLLHDDGGAAASEMNEGLNEESSMSAGPTLLTEMRGEQKA